MDVVKWVRRGVAILPLVLWAPHAASAAGPQLTLYEVTENMHLTHGKVVFRRATSPLGGFADVGSPLCPSVFVFKDGICFVNAMGSNDINTATGQGPVTGEVTVVVQDVNPFDSPETVVLSGDFSGHMDLSLTAITGLGTMTGTITLDKVKGKVKFLGVVRIPISCANFGGPLTTPCYTTSGSDAIPTGGVLVDASEFALGFAMVRLDIYFE